MRPALAFLLLATCLPSRAADDKPPFSYLFLNAAMTRDRDRDLDVTSEGYSVGGSVDLGPRSFFTAGYSSSDTGMFEAGGTTGEVQSNGFSLGFGGHASLTRRTDLTTSIAYVQSRTRVSGLYGEEEEGRDEGVSASIGLRQLIHPWVELSLGPSYSFVAGERGWDLSGGIAFLLLRDLWMDVDYYRSGGENSDGASVGLRTTLGD